MKSKYTALVCLIIGCMLLLFGLRINSEIHLFKEFISSSDRSIIDRIWAMELTGCFEKHPSGDIAYSLKGVDFVGKTTLIIGSLSLLFSAIFGRIYIKKQK